MTDLVTETIDVKYSDAPKSERGPWSIKDDKGRRFQGWPKALTRPEAGSTITIHYKVGDYMGKPQYDIQKIGGDAPAAPASAPYRAAEPPPRSGGSAQDRFIFITGIVGRSMGSGKFEVDRITPLTLEAADAWDALQARG